MAVHEAVRALRPLVRSCSKTGSGNPLECLAPGFARPMVTETPLPIITNATSDSVAQFSPSEMSSPPSAKPESFPCSKSKVLTTIFSWPTLEPIRFKSYDSNQLHLPMRRDILHRAVVYEGDMTRQGTASTKWRKDVHGSTRKLVPQKGTGRARAGDKKSPTRRGGGVAFGPHPRDFSTGLPRKIYDLAWRTALSYRYRRGQLLIVDNDIAIPKHTGPHLLSNIFEGHGWDSRHGRATLVTVRRRERLFREMAEVGKHGVVKDMFDIDVKDLLKTGHIVMEKKALDTILLAHSSDLGAKHSMEYAAKRITKFGKRSGVVAAADAAADLDEAASPEDPEEIEEAIEEANEEELEAVDEAVDEAQEQELEAAEKEAQYRPARP